MWSTKERKGRKQKREKENIKMREREGMKEKG